MISIEPMNEVRRETDQVLRAIFVADNTNVYRLDVRELSDDVLATRDDAPTRMEHDFSLA